MDSCMPRAGELSARECPGRHRLRPHRAAPGAQPSFGGASWEGASFHQAGKRVGEAGSPLRGHSLWRHSFRTPNLNNPLDPQQGHKEVPQTFYRGKRLQGCSPVIRVAGVVLKVRTPGTS